ncbi:MAG: DUF2461 domain-containing protein [bacterium]
MASRVHFQPSLFKFLRDLARNNRRDWFQANRDRFEQEAKLPALNFITEFGPHLQRISKHFLADPRPAGGSLFRIYRDIRFSANKDPYKTHVGIHFRHAAGKDAYTPGFYLHLAPRECFVGIGIWHPDNATLKQIRDAIVAGPAGWRRVVQADGFRQTYQVAGDRLKRPPRGYDPEFPLVEDLMWKDYTALAPLTQKQVTAGDFMDEFAHCCRTGGPYVKFICRALGQPY